MPDSPLHPSWGSVPFEERDLDAVLSGETADLPPGLRPVGDTLAALRAAPARAELSGEAAALAEFRAMAGFRAHGRHEAGRAARHRVRRRRGAPVSLRTGALMSVAAAAVIVVVLALGNNLPGPIQRLAHIGRPSTSPTAMRSPGTASATARRQGNDAPSRLATYPAPSHPTGATPHPTPTPSVGQQLCQEYFSYPNPKSYASWLAERHSLFKELSKLAGGPLQVLRYCSPYVRDAHPHTIPGTGSHAPAARSLTPGQVPQSQQSPPEQGNGAAQPGQGSGLSPTRP